ncbi:winged helix-turn-helix transcriptional regulator [Adhaeribacter radiodurans]|uniref:Helix-turn-helix transcriptional regulator n=1 Tax=Adhaeribacter radiodurans TaxID=2745197 RepID=A0A7L7L1S8_9BACT|nr:helix-turn-helix domain-containing protein [Adhaeribacter radiodurans]QMU26720.1 helix-turn-helix transcriptional regulator [Adhaeribacter radiodurans]
MKEELKPLFVLSKCRNRIVAIRDTLDVLNGKWKVPIIAALSFGNRSFSELELVIDGITSKMLSKELKDLEVNELVKRVEFDTKPITVEYELTEYGKTLQNVIEELAQWGIQHRKRMFAVSEKES